MIDPQGKNSPKGLEIGEKLLWKYEETRYAIKPTSSNFCSISNLWGFGRKRDVKIPSSPFKYNPKFYEVGPENITKFYKLASPNSIDKFQIKLIFFPYNVVLQNNNFARFEIRQEAGRTFCKTILMLF